jgi:hypothetical protein
MEKSQEEQEKKWIVDVDAAIDHFNEENPEGPKMTRETLSTELGVTYQSFTNYKAGKIPKFVALLQKIIERTGAEYSQIVKEK